VIQILIYQNDGRLSTFYLSGRNALRPYERAAMGFNPFVGVRFSFHLLSSTQAREIDRDKLNWVESIINPLKF